MTSLLLSYSEQSLNIFSFPILQKSMNSLRKKSVLWYIMCILLFLCIVKMHIIGRKIEYFEKWKNATK